MSKDQSAKAGAGAKERVKIEIWEHFAAAALGGILVFGVLAMAGTLYSGYHFMDDHELVRMEYAFRVGGSSLWEVLSSWLKGDLWWRFRPMYWAERVVLARFFGSHLLYWNIYTAIEGILTCYLLYFSARYTGNGRIVSVLFSAIVILGPQFTPWYRSANQENTGLLLCALTLWLIALQHHTGKERKRYLNVLIVAAAVVCGLMKESFTLFMPAFVMLKIYLEYCNAGNLRQCVRKNLSSCGAILAAMLVNIFCILFAVGVDNVSYAGFHKGTTVWRYFCGVKDSLFIYLNWYTYMGIVFVLLTIMCYCLIDRRYIRQYVGFLAIGGYIMAVQLIAHATSLMWDRYIIPYIVGWGMVFVLLGYRLFERDKVHRCVYISLLLFLLLRESPKAYLGAKNYAYDGKLIGQYLQCIENNVTPEDQIIGAFSAEELNLAVASYLEARGCVKMYSYDTAADTLTDSVQFAAVNGEAGEWEKAQAAVCYSWSVGLIVEKMGLISEEDYQIFTYGDYSVILKNL